MKWNNLFIELIIEVPGTEELNKWVDEFDEYKWIQKNEESIWCMVGIEEDRINKYRWVWGVLVVY